MFGIRIPNDQHVSNIGTLLSVCQNFEMMRACKGVLAYCQQGARKKFSDVSSMMKSSGDGRDSVGLDVRVYEQCQHPLVVSPILKEVVQMKR